VVKNVIPINALMYCLEGLCSPLRARSALVLLDGRPVGRWTHTFSRCPVSVAIRSETKLSLIKRAARVTPTIRRRNAPQYQPLNALVFSIDQRDNRFTPSWYPQSNWRYAWALPVKIKMNLNDLSSGAARVVERCKAINGEVRTATVTTTS
jgi:hypothetical protein